MGILSALNQVFTTPIENFLPDWLGRDLRFNISPQAGVESAADRLEEEMRELSKLIAPDLCPKPNPEPEPGPERIASTPARIVYKLSSAARAEIITAMAGLTFQVDSSGSFSVVGMETHQKSTSLDRYLDLTVVARAYFIERDRSKYHLSLEIFNTPKRTHKYDVSAIEIGIQQLTGGIERYIDPANVGPDHIVYENLETGIRYRFLTVGEAGIPTTRPCVAPYPEEPNEENPILRHLDTSAELHF